MYTCITLTYIISRAQGGAYEQKKQTPNHNAPTHGANARTY
jgi:hypothetical protein